MPSNNGEIEKRLWRAADELGAKTKLKSSEYSVPVLGLIFLRFANFKFLQVKGSPGGRKGRRPAKAGHRQDRLPG
jgi:type I restriction enzyme M protein